MHYCDKEYRSFHLADFRLSFEGNEVGTPSVFSGKWLFLTVAAPMLGANTANMAVATTNITTKTPILHAVL